MKTLLIALVLLPSISFGATYYVGQEVIGASDANDGLAPTDEGAGVGPWLTLDHATDIVAAGDSVIVKAGTYIDTDQSGGDPAQYYRAFLTANSGTSGNPIVFASRPSLAAVIRAYNLEVDRTYYALGVEDREYITWDGFKIEGGVIFRLSSSGPRYCELKNSEVTIGRSPWNDISLNWGAVMFGADYCLFSNVYVHDMNFSGSMGHNASCFMTGYGSNDNIIEYCTADAGSDSLLIAFGQKGGGSNDNTYRYNFATNAGIAFFGVGNSAGTISSDRNIYHNNVGYNVGRMFQFEQDVHNSTAYNNTAYNIGKFQSSWKNADSFTFYNNIADEITNPYWDALLEDSNREIYLHSTASVASDFLIGSDYNYYLTPYGCYGRLTYACVYAALSDFITGTTFGDNTSDSINPLFINAGGSTPRDYKRSSYPSDGEGVTYPSVVGAYVTGLEIIGYTAPTASGGTTTLGALTASGGN